MLQFLKNIFSYSLFKIVSMGLSVVYVMYLGKLLTAEVLGVYYLTITIITLAMVISRLGFDMFIVKKISVFIDNNNLTAIAKLFKFINYRIIPLSIFTIILIYIFSGKISFYLLDDEKYKDAIIIVSGTLYFYNMVFIYSEAFKAIGEFSLSVIFPSVLFPLLNIIGISILFPYFGEFGIFISVSVTVVIMYVLSLTLLEYKLAKHKTKSNYFSEVEQYLIPYDFYLISLSNYIFASIDTLTLGVLSSNSDVGIYNVLLRIVLPFSMLLIVINNVFARKFAIWYVNGEIDKCIDTYAKLVRISFIFGVVYFIIIIFFGSDMLLFFGTDYLEGESALLVLSIGFLVLLITGPSASILMMTSYEKKYKKIVIYIGILNIALSVIFIYGYGLIGAAISTSASLVLKNTASFFLARKYLGVKLF